MDKKPLFISQPDSLRLKELIRTAGDGAIDQSFGGGRITGTEVAYVVRGTEVDAVNHVYEGTVILADPGALTWSMQVALVYLVDAAKSPIAENKRCLSVRYGDYDVSGDLRPLYVTDANVGDTACIRYVDDVNVACVSGMLQTTLTYKYWTMPKLYGPFTSGACTSG